MRGLADWQLHVKAELKLHALSSVPFLGPMDWPDHDHDLRIKG